MKIAITIPFLLPEYADGHGCFAYEAGKRMAEAHPGHEFLFIFDRPYGEKFLFGKNINPVIAGPQARSPLLWKWWYDVKLPAVLKKYQADIVVSSDGICSLTTRLPQCLVVQDLSFLHRAFPGSRARSLFYRHYTPAFLRKAARVATVSAFLKNELAATYKTPADTIDIVYGAANDIFSPLSQTIKDQTREKYTGGKNYFVYAGTAHSHKGLTMLLKAFSVFKKRQQSNWKLVITGGPVLKNDKFIKSLATYKYRDDVVVTGAVAESERVLITGAAYALICASPGEGFGRLALEALQSDVPVITSAGSALQEIAGGGALHADLSDQDDIAAKMMLLYKDESLRAALIDKGRERARQFTWRRTAELLWENILKCKPHG